MSPQARFPLDDAALRLGLPREEIALFVARAWVLPADRERRAFDEEDIARIRLIHELRSRLEVNDEAVPLIMHLVDQLNLIHLELKGK
jgi:chaperone modulatory protein CbpM